MSFPKIRILFCGEWQEIFEAIISLRNIGMGYLVSVIRDCLVGDNEEDWEEHKGNKQVK